MLDFGVLIGVFVLSCDLGNVCLNWLAVTVYLFCSWFVVCCLRSVLLICCIGLLICAFVFGLGCFFAFCVVVVGLGYLP